MKDHPHTRLAPNRDAPRLPQQPGEVRIIGGRWKRSKLAVPVRAGLRPTPDRVRETLFNWLGQDLSGWRCVDAFAGSGALGMEAASRGAAQVCLIESDVGLARAIEAHAQRLQAQGVEVRVGDALSILARLPRQAWDVVFLDPPFGATAQGVDAATVALYARALAAAVPLLASQGWIYLEAAQPWSDETLATWHVQAVRRAKAGRVHYHLLQRLALVQEGPTNPQSRHSADRVDNGRI